MRVVVLLVGVVLLASACGRGADPTGGPVEEGAMPFGDWELADASPPIDVPDGARVTLMVEQVDGAVRAGGTAACNSYGGTATVGADGAWSLQDAAVTEMACDPPELMEVERTYLDALLDTDSWSVAGDELTLEGAAGSLTYRRLPVVAPASLTGTTWTLSGFIDGTGPDASISSTATDAPEAQLQLDADGTLTLFTGCRDFTGAWTTSGDEVVLEQFGEAADSRGLGPDGELDCGPAAVEQEQQVLAVVDDAFVPAVDGGWLTIHRGEVGLAFRDDVEDG